MSYIKTLITSINTQRHKYSPLVLLHSAHLPLESLRFCSEFFCVPAPEKPLDGGYFYFILSLTVKSGCTSCELQHLQTADTSRVRQISKNVEVFESFRCGRVARVSALHARVSALLALPFLCFLSKMNTDK